MCSEDHSVGVVGTSQDSGGRDCICTPQKAIATRTPTVSFLKMDLMLEFRRWIITRDDKMVHPALCPWVYFQHDETRREERQRMQYYSAIRAILFSWYTQRLQWTPALVKPGPYPVYLPNTWNTWDNSCPLLFSKDTLLASSGILNKPTKIRPTGMVRSCQPLLWSRQRSVGFAQGRHVSLSLQISRRFPPRRASWVREISFYWCTRYGITYSMSIRRTISCCCLLLDVEY